jgi:hypothetical protein
MEACVLAPGAGQPVRGRGRRQRPADDEPEVARPGAGDQPGIDGRSELLDDRHRVHRSFGQRGREPLTDLGGVGACSHMALPDAGEVLEAQFGGAPQCSFAIVHENRS